YYTDFSLRLNPHSQTWVAGEDSSLRVEVESLGPDAALRPVLTLRGDDQIGVRHSGCQSAGPQSVRCALEPMQPGDTLVRDLPVASDPSARGLRLLSGFVAAETSPTATSPGLDVDAIWVSLVGR